MDIGMCKPRFMLDRDQVFYSKAFRRLAGKAQVFVTGGNDHKRTRLTHTLEVSQIARSIAQALGLDLDLVEAIALGHDLGHTPFGHAGERILHEIMTPAADHLLGERCPLCCKTEELPRELYRFLGFKHNLQGIVVAMELEKNYKNRGLHLTEYTLYGIQAHSSGKYSPKRMKNHDLLGYYQHYLDTGCKRDGMDAWSLEALLVAQADEIAQIHHDMEDALVAGFITPAQMTELMAPMLKHLTAPLSSEEREVLENPAGCDSDMFSYLFTRIVVDLLMTMLARDAAAHIDALGGIKPLNVPAYNLGNNSKLYHVLSDPHQVNEPAVQQIFTFRDADEEGSFAQAVAHFSGQIVPRIISAPEVKQADADGQETITKLFRYYYENPMAVPDSCVYEVLSRYHDLAEDASLRAYCRPEFQRGNEAQLWARGTDSARETFRELLGDRTETTCVEELLLMRAICSHIACMTDSYAKKTCGELNI